MPKLTGAVLAFKVVDKRVADEYPKYTNTLFKSQILDNQSVIRTDEFFGHSKS